MKNPLVAYTLARIGIFGGILALLLVFNINPYVAVIFATMLSFSFSLIFLRKLREASSAKLYDSVNSKKKTVDESHEDEN